MTNLSLAAVAMIRKSMAAAPHGERSAEAERLAALLAVSAATVWRAAKRRGAKRTKRKPLRPEYRAWVDEAMRAAHADEGQPPLALDLAIRTCVEAGALPPEAAEMPISTAHRIAREAGYRDRKRHCRISAEWPGQAIQMDGSSSRHLVPVRRLESGEWLLKVHRRPTHPGGYKNKPLGPDRERVWIYAAWDVCTGAVVSRYVVAKGESATDELEFFLWLVRGGREPIRGLPDDLWVDLGNTAHHRPTLEFLERAGVRLRKGKAYAKARMGGVERSHRTRWARFERTLFRRGDDLVALDQLNARLARYETEQNAGRLSRTLVDGAAVPRSTAWSLLAARRPKPLRELPEDALRSVHREVERVVTAAGTVLLDGEEYEVAVDAAPRLIGRRVLVRRRLKGSGDAVTVEDAATSLRAAAEPLRRRKYGSIVHDPPLPLETLLEGGVAAEADVYGEGAAPARTAGNVVPMPVRPGPEAELPDPLAVPDRAPHLAAAMAELQSLCPRPLDAAARSAAEDHLLARDLASSAIAELAAALTRAATSAG